MTNLDHVDKLTEFPPIEDEDRNEAGIMSSFSKLLWWKKSTAPATTTSTTVTTTASTIKAEQQEQDQDKWTLVEDNVNSENNLEKRKNQLVQPQVDEIERGPSPSRRSLFRSDSQLSNRSTRSNNPSPGPDHQLDNSLPSNFEARTLPNVLRRISNLIAMGTQSQTNIKKYWMPDSNCKECYECAEKFTTFRRRHHCRVCGQIFCSRCCSQEIPGKIIGYSGDLRVCVYCCRIVLSYLQSADLNADLTDDLRLVQEDLQSRFGNSGERSNENSFMSSGSGLVSSNLGGNSSNFGQSSSTMNIETPTSYHRSNLLRRKVSVGYQEERFATTSSSIRNNTSDSGAFDYTGAGIGPSSLDLSDSKLNQNLINIKALWEEMNHPINGIEWSTHRHNMMRNFNNCVVGSELVDWLLAHRKITLRGQGVQIGQMLIESNLIECVSQVEQFFLDAYSLYRPTTSPCASSNLKMVQESIEDNDNDNTSVDYGDSSSLDPLWVKQIKSPDKDIDDNDSSGDSDSDIPSRNTDSTADKSSLNNVVSSNSFYSLDINVNTNTVSMSKPKEPAITSQSSSLMETLSEYTGLFAPDCPDNSSKNSTKIPSGPPSGPPSLSIISDLVGCETQMPVGTQYIGGGSSSSRKGFGTMSSTSETITDEFLQKTLQMQKNQGQDLNAPVGWHSPQQLTSDSELLAFQRLCNAYIRHENKLLGQLLENFNLSSSWADIILPIVHKVTEIVKPDVRHADDDMDIRQYVQIKKVIGGRKEDCRIVNGVVCTKNIANRSMRSKLKAPKILLIGSSIDYQRFENKLLSLEPLVMQEYDFLKNIVARIASLTPDLVLVEKTVARLAQEFMLEQGITLVINLKPSVMERVARSTQAVIISSADTHVGRPQLGVAHNFYLENFRISESEIKTLMFFDGCAMHLGCTVLLRGGTNSELTRVKKILNFLIFVAYNWRLERSFHIDSYALPPALPKDPTPSGDSSKSSSNKKNRGEKNEGRLSSLETIQNCNDPLQNESSKMGEIVKVEDTTSTISNSSNEGIKNFLDNIILSASPYIKYQMPYLETMPGKECKLRKFFPQDIYWSQLLNRRSNSFGSLTLESTRDINNYNQQKENEPRWKPQHPFVSFKVTQTGVNSDENFHSLIADFRRKGGRLDFTANRTSGQSNYSTDNDTGRISPSKRVLKSNHSSWNTLDYDVKLLKNSNGVGRVDSLDPFRHQKLAVLFCSYSPISTNAPDFCVNPWVVNMDLYGRNDISLGMFLERYCFRKSYLCPARNCDTSMIHHIRKFVHQDGCVQVKLKELTKPILGNSETILMWTLCEHCKSVSSIVPLSVDAWSFSFAKYLELRFHGQSYLRRGLDSKSFKCDHSLHQQHEHYFAQHPIIASFKYSKIRIWEISLPPEEIEIKIEPKSVPELADDIKVVAITGHGVYTNIIEILISLKDNSNISKVEENALLLLEQLKVERIGFKTKIEEIQLNLTSPNLDIGHCKRDVFLWKIMDQIEFLKSNISESVHLWNRNIQDLINLRKKEEKLLGKGSNKLDPDFSSSHQQQQAISSSQSHSRNDSSDIFIMPPNLNVSTLSSFDNTGSTQEMDRDSIKSSSGSTVDMSLAGVIEELSSSTAKPPPAVVAAEDVLVLNPLALLNVSALPGAPYISLPSSRIDQQIDRLRSNSTNNNDKQQAGLMTKSSIQTVQLLDDSTQHLDKKVNVSTSSSVKNILQSFLSGSASGQVIQLPWLSIEHHFHASLSIIPITVYENEPSSVVSFALCSTEYKGKMMEITKSKLNSKNSEENDDSGGTTGGNSNNKKMKLGIDNMEDLLQSSTSSKASAPESVYKPNLNENYFGDNFEDKVDKAGKGDSNQIYVEFHSSNVAKFYCKIYFAEQFRSIRRLCISEIGEEAFARSISRCVSWAATGGKSGSTFCKTLDDRFVVKQMSNFEIKSFLNFAPNYFEYIQNSYSEKKPTVLAKIIGVYRVGFRNSHTNSASKTDILIMENLFYGRSISQKFDLKGSKRNRLANTTSVNSEDLVLLDENLVNMACENSLYIRPHTKTVLSLALNNDSRFLASQTVMDYSLLVGLEEEKNELIIGIIDYIRTFTWDKMIESKLKSSGILGGQGKMPTVVSPEEYQNRFCEAMDRYFLIAPDRWVGLGLGVDS